MPTEVKLNNSNTQKINFTYAADGTKLRKLVNDGGNITTNDYAGSYIYINNVLKQFSHPEGYVAKNGNNFDYVYHYKDHLGSVRLAYSDLNGNGSIDASTEILLERNTYPFGLEHKGYNSNVISENNFQTYLGQELNKELGLGWLTFRYRNYMPELGRFFGVDPVSEDYMSISTYQFAHNNPVWKIELEGLEGLPTEGSDQINYEPVVGHTDTGTSAIPIGDGTGNHGSTLSDFTMSISDFQIGPSTNIRSGQFNDSDFGGFITPASDAQYQFEPATAVMRDISYVGLSLLGIDGIDNAAATVANPDVSTGDKVLATAGVLLTTRGGSKVKTSPKVTPKIHGNSANSPKPSGNYRITFKSGKTYNGVGQKSRMNSSSRRLERRYNDKAVDKTHVSSRNRKEAYKKEHVDIEADGGAGNTNRNYNTNNSPGKKIIENGG
tara:strand:- start:3676 stop:4989 length:1314 start_codon:yes stop_codon:yes gene_type:complete